jgi:hypothetical protein
MTPEQCCIAKWKRLNSRDGHEMREPSLPLSVSANRFLPIVHSALNGPGATIARRNASKLDGHYRPDPPSLPATGRVREAPQPGIYKASTVIFSNVAAMRSRNWKDKIRLYLRTARHTHDVPVGRTALSTLEGGKQCLLVTSGLAAIATVSMSACSKTGDEVLIA